MHISAQNCPKDHNHCTDLGVSEAHASVGWQTPGWTWGGVGCPAILQHCTTTVPGWIQAPCGKGHQPPPCGPRGSSGVVGAPRCAHQGAAALAAAVSGTEAGAEVQGQDWSTAASLPATTWPRQCRFSQPRESPQWPQVLRTLQLQCLAMLSIHTTGISNLPRGLGISSKNAIIFLLKRSDFYYNSDK